MRAFYFTENVRDQIGRTTTTIFDNQPERRFIDERWSKQTRAIAYEVKTNCERMTTYQTREFIRKTYKIPCCIENEIIFYCYCIWNGKTEYIETALGMAAETLASKLNNDASVEAYGPAAVKKRKKRTAETPQKTGKEYLQVKNDSLFNEFRKPKRKYEFRNRKPNKYKEQ
jgi:hypothetical protein